MVSIDLVYRTVQTIINKDNNGYVSPTEFNLIANKVQMDIFRNYFEEHNRDENKQNKGQTSRGYSNLALYERQRINQFSDVEIVVKDTVKQIFNLPEDLYIIEDNGVTIADPLRQTSEGNKVVNSVIEEAERDIIGFLNLSEASPTILYPVYERYSNFIKVYPPTINNIQIKYLRVPKPPKWTYRVIGGKELFDPTLEDFKNFELHESELGNIIVRVLLEFGINLREAEVVQIADALKQETNIKDNQ